MPRSGKSASDEPRAYPPAAPRTPPRHSRRPALAPERRNRPEGHTAAGSGMKRRSVAGRGLHPDAAAVALDDLSTDGQADAGARVFGAGVQALEDLEDPVLVLGVDADPVVAYRE